MDSMKLQLAKSARTTPCDLCCSTQFEVVSQSDRRRQALATVICKHCGLVSHEQIPSEVELENYYANEYRNDYHGEFSPSAHRVVRARQVGSALLNDLITDLKPDDHIFEIGAGIGCTVKAFQDAGFRASGIEPGQGFCNYARKQVGVDVQQLSLADVPQKPCCNVALLVHVIEHLRSPREAITHIRTLLQQDGLLYVECPDLSQTHAAPSKLFHYAHIYNFVPTALASLCESCGFDLVREIPSNAKVIKHLYKATGPREPQVDPHSYATALAGIFRYNTLTYHLRSEYLIDRYRRAKELLRTRLISKMPSQNRANDSSAESTRKAA